MVKHYAVWINKEWRYLCNQACNVTKEKLTEKREEVTCLNCLHIINTS